MEKSLEDRFLDALDNWLICEYCGRQAQDVNHCENPYNKELYNDSTLHNICSDCYNEALMYF